VRAQSTGGTRPLRPWQTTLRYEVISVAQPDVVTATSGANGLFSNTYLVAAPGGTVVVDPPMLLGDARAVRTKVEELGRPVAAVIYTHPHPDHVNGTTELLDGVAVPVLATPDTDRVSREIDGPKREFWTPIFPDDYPPVTTFATELVEGGSSIDVAGLPFTVHDLGAGECATASIWVTGELAFVGDLVYSHVHPWLFEARSQQWLDQLERAAPLLAEKRLLVGHGEPGDSRLLAEQADYIREFRSVVQALAGGQPSLTAEATDELLHRMCAYWPGAPLEALVAMSANPVAAELVAELAAS
jgi:glyoxylase-like metal-dependent hydrolase (beta-lactamase superfamily II)